MFAWGGGGSHFNKGQCGHGSTDDIKSPLPVKFFQYNSVRDFACGGYHTVVICENKEIYSWGSGTYGELGQGEVG